MVAWTYAPVTYLVTYISDSSVCQVNKTKQFRYYYNHKVTFLTYMNMIYPVTEWFKISQLPCFDIEYIAQGETEHIDK